MMRNTAAQFALRMLISIVNHPETARLARYVTRQATAQIVRAVRNRSRMGRFT